MYPSVGKSIIDLPCVGPLASSALGRRSSAARGSDSAVAMVRVGASRLCRAAARGNGGDSVVVRVRGDWGFGDRFCSAACGHARFRSRSRGVGGGGRRGVLRRTGVELAVGLWLLLGRVRVVGLKVDVLMGSRNIG
jgi:hypothetical protein